MKSCQHFLLLIFPVGLEKEGGRSRITGTGGKMGIQSLDFLWHPEVWGSCALVALVEGTEVQE